MSVAHKERSQVADIVVADRIPVAVVDIDPAANNKVPVAVAGNIRWEMVPMDKTLVVNDIDHPMAVSCSSS